jgi:phosphohistidine phosphatase
MTIEVIVVRHAIAFERHRKRWPDDALRPLTADGRRRFRRAARGLRRWQPRPDVVLSSPFVRAWQTAQLLAEVCGWPEARACEELEPDTQPARLLSRLRKTRGKRIAVVGHEPHLSRFMSACLAKRGPVAFELRKGGVAHLLFEKQVAAGRGALVAFLPPRALRLMAKRTSLRSAARLKKPAFGVGSTRAASPHASPRRAYG